MRMPPVPRTNSALACLVATLLLLQSFFAWHDHQAKTSSLVHIRRTCARPAMLYKPAAKEPRLICAEQMPSTIESFAQIDCRTGGCRVIEGGMLNSWRLALGAPMNLNTATVQDLMLLPHIGRTTAEAIVAQRAKHGGFQDLQTLHKIRGIGPKRLRALCPFLSLDNSLSP